MAASTSELINALLQFAFASVAMILGNKKAVSALPLPCTLVIIQAIGTLVLLQLPHCRRQMASFSPAVARSWLPVAGLFSFMLFTSLKSFVYSGVATVLIFRNVGAIVTTVVEYFVRGEKISVGVVASEVTIVAGAALYVNGAVDFSLLGLFWIFANVGGQVAYGIVLKSKMETDPQIKQLSKFSMSRYNNLLCLPMVAVVLLVEGEQQRAADAVAAVAPAGWAYIALTCIFGFLISTSGFGLQKLVSAATFIVINNLTKFFNILLGVLLLGEQVRGPYGIGGCIIALAAGCWYSFEQSKLNDQRTKSQKAK